VPLKTGVPLIISGDTVITEKAFIERCFNLVLELHCMVSNQNMTFRIGQGYDIHRLVSDRDLILGGVKIEHSKGLLGHSDADVLTHAIMDAMLGALALGDIGHYFPPTDSKWQGANSIELLKQVHKLVSDRGWQINNIDSSIIAEQPKLKPHILSIRTCLADALKINLNCISVKARTNEGVDSMGREEAIAVHAIVLLTQLTNSY
jgi:2-C-methyl-D-erythritol 2,4-cyclodiphosphate synthase